MDNNTFTDETVPVLNLATLIATEFGVSGQVASDALRYSEKTIDGAPWPHDVDPFSVPVAFVEGKRILVKSDVRQFAFTYRPSPFGTSFGQDRFA